MDPNLGLIPDWKIDQTLEYVIYKHEDFKFKNKQGENIERTSRLHVTRLSETEVKAYLPDGLLSGLKATNTITRYLKDIDHDPYNSFNYHIEEDGTFEEIKDIEICVDNITKLKIKLLEVIQDDDPEDIIGSLEMFEKFPHILESKLSEDIETLHDYYGKDIYDGYLFDLEEGGKTSKSMSDKILTFLKVNVGKIHLLQTDFLNSGDYQMEMIKGSDTVSDLSRQDLPKIKQLFLDHKFDLEEIEDFACRHQKYLYGKDDYILKNYSSHFKLNSSVTDKQIRIEIRRVK